MYQTINNATPQAYIARKKSRVKIYNTNTTYFNDGENFEIELFNPKTTRVLCKIILNGVDITSSGIIVNPGQRIFLERFIDSNNKFVFQTYEVDGSDQQVLNAISKNGDIEVKFYDEYFPTTYLGHRGSTLPYGYLGTPLNGNPNLGYGSSNFYVGNGSFNTTSYNSSNVITGTLTSKSIETGRVEKGESSNQSFETSFGSFNTYSCKDFKYKMLPFSSKPTEVKGIKRYCTNCGKSIKSEWNFCPKCSCKI